MDYCAEHNKEEHARHCLKKVKGMKIFFLKSFVISIILLIISCTIVMLGYNRITVLAEKLYGVAPHDYSLIFGIVVGMWKVLIVQFTLVPFIALAMIEHHLRGKHTAAE